MPWTYKLNNYNRPIVAFIFPLFLSIFIIVFLLDITIFHIIYFVVSYSSKYLNSGIFEWSLFIFRSRYSPTVMNNYIVNNLLIISSIFCKLILYPIGISFHKRHCYCQQHLTIYFCRYLSSS